MYRQILTPDKKNHSIEMPEKFFGKKVEVIVVEIDDTPAITSPPPPAGKKTPIAKLLEGFGTSPDFPSTEEIRSKAWTSKW